MNQQLLSLARYRVGDTVYRVRLVYPHGTSPRTDSVPDDDEWIFTELDVHSKIFYERGYLPRPWRSSQSLPRVDQIDFSKLMMLLAGKFDVSDFTIEDVDKSRRTGEIIYRSGDCTVPESVLFPTHVEARRECARIKLMLRKWTRGEL